jgi:hypothetical protein
MDVTIFMNYVHCVSKERLELLREGMSCVELEIML